MTYRKKLIEVALPLEAINKESAREKSIRHGHPSTLHLWWARRPLATCRAVLFASLVDDPSSRPDEFPTEEAQEKERKRLFEIIEQLVKWENVTNQEVLDAAKAEIIKSTDGNPPPVLDPFCGGGSIPLEAQRLGLEAHGSDLNPVAVVITKALIEIPPRFANQPPVNPDSRSKTIPNPKSKTQNPKFYYGAQGLAKDVRYYGQWLRDEAFKQIGHLYPKVNLPQEYGGTEATVIAWLWARTVKCPNPVCGARMPLVSSFKLSTKKDKQVWIETIVDESEQPPTIHFQVKTGKGKSPEPPKIGRGAKFKCLACNQVAGEDNIRAEFHAKRNNAQLITIVAESSKGRIYLPPDKLHIDVAISAKPEWKPEEEMNQETSNLVSGRGYGITHWYEIFTNRQLVALTTFSDLVGEVREKVLADAVAAGIPDDNLPLCKDGKGATAYADAVVTYLAIAVDRLSDRNSTICSWDTGRDSTRNTFARQAIPMTWDYAEANPLSNSTGNFMGAIDWITKVIEISPCGIQGVATQVDATTSDILHYAKSIVVCTDPPYYDNIGYADLSDFFYVWLRRSLSSIYPDLFRTIAVPKEKELVAIPYRFGGNKEKAKKFFEDGLNKVFMRMREGAHPDYPFSVFYAFKQTETEDDDENKINSAVSSTGWETMLEGLIKAGFTITGTLPMRTELSNRTVASGTNALASSIVLVCRPRPESAPSTTRRQFVTTLKRELPDALQKLKQGNIAPVDLAQASIGPGMAIYSRYSKVLESDGTKMPVRKALQLINQMLDEYLVEQEGEFDAETRFALIWFEQYTFKDGLFGEAETLSKAKNTSVQGMVEAGVLFAKAGKVRLLRRDELPKDWNPQTDKHLTVWEATQYMIRALLDEGGETSAAILLSQLGTIGEAARELAYRLYNICERQGWASEGVAYNSLVISWSEISRLATDVSEVTPLQMSLI
jgi:putative DNA methylase